MSHVWRLRPISMVRLSSHFRFLRPSAVAIILASVVEGDPSLFTTFASEERCAHFQYSSSMAMAVMITWNKFSFYNNDYLLQTIWLYRPSYTLGPWNNNLKCSSISKLTGYTIQDHSTLSTRTKIRTICSKQLMLVFDPLYQVSNILYPTNYIPIYSRPYNKWSIIC